MLIDMSQWYLMYLSSLTVRNGSVSKKNSSKDNWHNLIQWTPPYESAFSFHLTVCIYRLWISNKCFTGYAEILFITFSSPRQRTSWPSHCCNHRLVLCMTRLRIEAILFSRYTYSLRTTRLVHVSSNEFAYDMQVFF